MLGGGGVEINISVNLSPFGWAEQKAGLSEQDVHFVHWYICYVRVLMFKKIQVHSFSLKFGPFTDLT